jgi:hypothetical protein
MRDGFSLFGYSRPMRDGFLCLVTPASCGMVYGYSLFIVLVRGDFIVLVAFRVGRDFYV